MPTDVETTAPIDVAESAVERSVVAEPAASSIADVDGPVRREIQEFGGRFKNHDHIASRVYGYAASTKVKGRHG